MAGTLTPKQVANQKLSDLVERHKALEDKRKESKARSREYYRRLRDAGKVQD